MPKQKHYSLLDNSRFYILTGSILLSLCILSYLRLTIVSDQLFYIRSQQVMGLLCILYWYLAIVISPLGAVIGKERLRHLAFARRAIGVSAFYFALLHTSIALWGQLGGLGQLQYLPSLFKWSLAGGAFALIILSALAATSFDKVVSMMTFRKWKWLHRLVYIAGVVAILHIWSIGTHLVYSNLQITALVMLAILSGLESFRIAKNLNQKLRFDKAQAVVLGISLWAVIVVLIAMIPTVIKSYHGRHADGQGHAHSRQKDSQ